MHHKFIQNVKEKLISTQQFEKSVSILSTKQLNKQRLLVIGYVRSTCKRICDQSDVMFLLLSYSTFYGNPYTDPANYVTDTEKHMSSLYRKKGNVLFKNHQYEEAIIKYTTALNFNPNDDKIHCNKSLCHLLLNKTLSAYDDASCALKLCVTNPKCWYRLGIASEKLNDLTTAFLAFRTAKCVSDTMHNNAQIEHDIDRKFKAINRQIHKRKHKNDKLWIEYFDEFAVQDTFKVKLEYYLQQTDLTAGELLTKPNYAIYVGLIHDLFIMVRRSTIIKYMVHKAPILDLPTIHKWAWCVSYTTLNGFEYNKRIFIIDVVCQEMGVVECLKSSFGVPSADQVISAMLQAMVHPSAYTHPYKPRGVLIANRLKYAYEEVKNTMECYGISCALQTKESAVESCTTHNTHVDGFNYRFNREEYLRFSQVCSNDKCEMTKKALWKISGDKFKKCVKCKRATYCSRKCQKYDWKFGHKIGCDMF
eukprot:157784_1